MVSYYFNGGSLIEIHPHLKRPRYRDSYSISQKPNGVYLSPCINDLYKNFLIYAPTLVYVSDSQDSIFVVGGKLVNVLLEPLEISDDIISPAEICFKGNNPIPTKRLFEDFKTWVKNMPSVPKENEIKDIAKNIKNKD